MSEAEQEERVEGTKVLVTRVFYRSEWTSWDGTIRSLSVHHTDGRDLEAAAGALRRIADDMERDAKDG